MLRKEAGAFPFLSLSHPRQTEEGWGWETGTGLPLLSISLKVVTLTLALPSWHAVGEETLHCWEEAGEGLLCLENKTPPPTSKPFLLSSSLPFLHAGAGTRSSTSRRKRLCFPACLGGFSCGSFLLQQCLLASSLSCMDSLCTATETSPPL